MKLSERVKGLREQLENKVKSSRHDAWSIIYHRIEPGLYSGMFEAYMCKAPGMDGRYYVCKPNAQSDISNGPDMRYLRAGCVQRGTPCRMVRINIEDLGAGIVAGIEGTTVREL